MHTSINLDLQEPRMHRRVAIPIARTISTLLLALPCLAQAATAYAQTKLVATTDSFDAAVIDPTLVNAWGIAIRPAGLGGHFWVTANGWAM
jgi:hypothetical protein